MSSVAAGGVGSGVLSSVASLRDPDFFASVLVQLSNEEQTLIGNIDRCLANGLEAATKANLIERIENFISKLDKVTGQLDRVVGGSKDVAQLRQAKQAMEQRLAAIRNVLARSSKPMAAEDFSQLWDKERQLTAAFETRCYGVPFDSKAMSGLAKEMKGLIETFQVEKQRLEQAGQGGQGDAWVMGESINSMEARLAQVEGMIAFYQPREQAAVQTIQYAGIPIQPVKVEDVSASRTITISDLGEEWKELVERGSVNVLLANIHLGMARSGDPRDRALALEYFKGRVEDDFAEMPEETKIVFLAQLQSLCGKLGNGEMARAGYQALAQLAEIQGDHSLYNRAVIAFNDLVASEANDLMKSGKALGATTSAVFGRIPQGRIKLYQRAIDKYQKALALLEQLSPRQKTGKQERQALYCQQEIARLRGEVWSARKETAKEFVAGLFTSRRKSDATAAVDRVK